MTLREQALLLLFLLNSTLPAAAQNDYDSVVPSKIRWPHKSISTTAVVRLARVKVDEVRLLVLRGIDRCSKT
jgi:hypothetical protein